MCRGVGREEHPAAVGDKHRCTMVMSRKISALRLHARPAPQCPAIRFVASQTPPRLRKAFATRAGLARGGRCVVCLVLGLAALAWACGNSAWAQSNATPTEPVAATSPAAPPFELKPRPGMRPSLGALTGIYFQFAYYTIHFHYDVNHQQSYLFDAEYHFKETWLGGQWIAGMALFQNSFGQFSQYLFGGLLWRPIEEHQPFYVKLTAGPLHGYSGPVPGQDPVQQLRRGPCHHSRRRVLREALLRRVRAARNQRGAAHDRHFGALIRRRSLRSRQ